MSSNSFDYIRSRNRAAVICLVSLAVFLPALVLPRSGDDLTTRKLILFFSLGAMLISAVWFLVRWDEVKRLIRLRDGQGILARWTIDQAQWAGFRAQSAEWDVREGVRANDVDLRQDAGDTGIQIAVTLDGILVGESFHPIEKNVRITVFAIWMEFYQFISKPDGQPFHVVVRVPLQPGKESLAADVQYAYQRMKAGGLSGKLTLLYMALAIFLGLPLITLLIWFVAKMTGWVE